MSRISSCKMDGRSVDSSSSAGASSPWTPSDRRDQRPPADRRQRRLGVPLPTRPQSDRWSPHRSQIRQRRQRRCRRFPPLPLLCMYRVQRVRPRVPARPSRPTSRDPGAPRRTRRASPADTTRRRRARRGPTGAPTRARTRCARPSRRRSIRVVVVRATLCSPSSSNLTHLSSGQRMAGVLGVAGFSVGCCAQLTSRR